MFDLEGKTFLVTGGTGTFGQAFTRIVLDEYKPKSIRIYSRGELLQQEMARKFVDTRLRFLIGDVRDRARLARALEGVDIVVHAAALKQVPACETNPTEAVRTNIEGTVNVTETSIDMGVSLGIAIGTDKAANPNNFYGATKLVMEKYFIQSNVYSALKRTRFSCVRYGNVMMSRGSVIPIFLAQRTSGILTVTDPRMTRFWITVDQGARFVLRSLQRMLGGEVFIPKIPSSKVTSLARVIAPKAKLNFMGIQPGEKVHETLITSEESRRTVDLGDCYAILPEKAFRPWSGEPYPLGTPVPSSFSYSSNSRNSLLSGGQLKDLLGRLGVLA